MSAEEKKENRWSIAYWGMVLNTIYVVLDLLTKYIVPNFDVAAGYMSLSLVPPILYILSALGPLGWHFAKERFLSIRPEKYLFAFLFLSVLGGIYYGWLIHVEIEAKSARALALAKAELVKELKPNEFDIFGDSVPPNRQPVEIISDHLWGVGFVCHILVFSICLYYLLNLLSTRISSAHHKMSAAGQETSQVRQEAERAGRNVAACVTSINSIAHNVDKLKETVAKAEKYKPRNNTKALKEAVDRLGQQVEAIRGDLDLNSQTAAVNQLKNQITTEVAEEMLKLLRSLQGSQKQLGELEKHVHDNFRTLFGRVVKLEAHNKPPPATLPDFPTVLTDGFRLGGPFSNHGSIGSIPSPGLAVNMPSTDSPVLRWGDLTERQKNYAMGRYPQLRHQPAQAAAEFVVAQDEVMLVN